MGSFLQRLRARSARSHKRPSHHSDLQPHRHSRRRYAGRQLSSHRCLQVALLPVNESLFRASKVKGKHSPLFHDMLHPLMRITVSSPFKFLGWNCEFFYAHGRKANVHKLPASLKGSDMLVYDALRQLGLEVEIRPIPGQDEIEEAAQYDTHFTRKLESTLIPNMDLWRSSARSLVSSMDGRSTRNLASMAFSNPGVNMDSNMSPGSIPRRSRRRTWV